MIIPLTLLMVSCSARVRETPVAPMEFTISPSKDNHPISQYIYGANQPDWKVDQGRFTSTRVGGNRMTAYNWETNASNAGNDYKHQNDNYLGGGDIPGEVELAALRQAQSHDAAMILTVPMAGYVSADKNGDGDVSATPDFIHKRFVKSVARKGKAFTTTPDIKDGIVYQDEFVSLVERMKKPDPPVWYSLDNEPDLWNSTHERLWPKPPTYVQMLQISKDFASAIKDVAPKSLVFGPASYGWQGYVRLQNAPDANDRDFLDYYLDNMKAAESVYKKRILDVLDIHWYPEAKGNGKRITDGASENAEARMQAPRSLWDPSYVEDSWISENLGKKPITLIPLMKKKIEQHYPGTLLAITEYNFGAGGHISGGIAQADILGIFGREGVFAAALWGLSDNDKFIRAGFDAYRNYDGKGGRFGETSVQAKCSDNNSASIYASKRGDKIIVVAINKTSSKQSFKMTIEGGFTGTAKSYVITSSNPAPQPGQPVDFRVGVGQGVLLETSITVLELGK